MTDKTIDDDLTVSGAPGVLLAGRYRVVRLLGQGGMGSVWLAEDTQLDNREVAIKMLPSVLVSNRRAYNQLKAEALVSLRLTHPNIATVRAFEENGGNPFLVVDYIDGMTLDDYLADRERLSEREVVRLLRPIAAALDYAHGEGVIHRDVKPGNVMVRRDGHPFILDFGIAREIQETMTRVTGKLSSGTLLYMSPEQLNGWRPTPAQDVYSFAAMVYECLTGAPPFVRGQVESQIRHRQPAPLPQTIEVGPAVMSGLAKGASRRPPSCSDVLKASARSRRVRSGGAGTLLAALLGLAALVAALVFAWNVYNRHAEEKSRRTVLRRLALEYASDVAFAREEATRERYRERPGLAGQTAKLIRCDDLGLMAMRTEDWDAATNHFRLAKDCAEWLVSNAALCVACEGARNAALRRRAEAEMRDAPDLASNIYAQACNSYTNGVTEQDLSGFVVARAAFERAAEEFMHAGVRAVSERKRLDDEAAAARTNDAPCRSTEPATGSATGTVEAPPEPPPAEPPKLPPPPAVVTLTLLAKIDGRPVEGARIVESGFAPTNATLPWTSSGLLMGQKLSPFAVEYAEGDRKWRGEFSGICVDWAQPKTLICRLKEVRELRCEYEFIPYVSGLLWGRSYPGAVSVNVDKGPGTATLVDNEYGGKSVVLWSKEPQREISFLTISCDGRRKMVSCQLKSRVREIMQVDMSK